MSAVLNNKGGMMDGKIFLATLSLGLFALACSGIGVSRQALVEGARLFDGEFIVAADGIYTFAHYYSHPENGRKVIMVGMNHGGDKEYFAAIENILRGTEVVLFEGSISKKIDEEAKKKDAEKIKSDNAHEAFLVSIATYFWEAPRYLELLRESQAINHRRENWFVGDAEFFRKFRDKESLRIMNEKFERHFEAYPLERKIKIVEYLRGALAKIEQKTFTRRDFGESFVVLWSDPSFVELILGILGAPRDEMVFKTFDQLIHEKNPQTIGIKFGAGHMSNQRRLLEQRGYIHQFSTPLRNLKF